jgi:DNA replication protein DnaC
MSATVEIVPSVLDRIRRTLVGLKMPRALEVLDQTMRQLERGEASALEVIDTLFAEELTLRENRRVKMALRMAKLSTIKTRTRLRSSEGWNEKSNPASALAQLDFIECNEVIHFLGPPGTGKSHLATALGVEAVKAGRSVYFASLADIVSVLAKAEREGQCVSVSVSCAEPRS